MTVKEYGGKNQRGFSLIEMLVSITVLATLIGIAIPSYNYIITRQRLRIATEDLYNMIKIAQSQSLKKQGNLYLSFIPGANWCYGLNDSASCDCTVANSCQISGVETVIKSTNYSTQSLALNVTGFSGSAGNPYIAFNGIRGTVSVPGTASFSLSGISTTMTTNAMGLVTVCSSNHIASYPSCGP